MSSGVGGVDICRSVAPPAETCCERDVDVKKRLIPSLISSFFPMRFSPPPSSYEMSTTQGTIH